MNKGLTKFQKILIIISILIILFFSITSIIALKTGKAVLNQKADNSTVQAEKTNGSQNDLSKESLNNESYVNLGTIRAITGDTPGIPLVLQIQLPYETQDIPFFEELMQKKLKFIELVIEYFKNQSFQQCNEKGEKTVKQELLAIINSELILGKVNNIFFTEYIFLD